MGGYSTELWSAQDHIANPVFQKSKGWILCPGFSGQISHELESRQNVLDAWRGMPDSLQRIQGSLGAAIPTPGKGS